MRPLQDVSDRGRLEFSIQILAVSASPLRYVRRRTIENTRAPLKQIRFVRREDHCGNRIIGDDHRILQQHTVDSICSYRNRNMHSPPFPCTHVEASAN